MNYWEIGCGSAGRDYSNELLNLGIVCVGGDRYVERMEQVEVGDRVILKKGRQLIVAVGEITEKPERFPQGEWVLDYDGWDLRAYAKVAWHKKQMDSPVRLTQSAMTSIGLTSELRPLVDKIITQTKPLASTSSLEERRHTVPALRDDDLRDALIDDGCRPLDAAGILQAFDHVRQLARYYRSACDSGRCRAEDIREHEIRAFLVIPLLVALGWSEQQMKIEHAVEGKHIDIACFSRPYLNDGDGGQSEDVALVVETKRFSQGLDAGVLDQAGGYARSFPRCRSVVVTNGYIWKTFVREKWKRGFAEQPTAYLNVLKPRSGSVFYPLAGGAGDVLKQMMPNHAQRR